MSEQTTAQNLQESYDAQYNSGDDEWRRIGAIKKARNIFDITKNLVPFDKVIEIGAGEGSLLKILAQNPQFAKETGHFSRDHIHYIFSHHITSHWNSKCKREMVQAEKSASQFL